MEKIEVTITKADFLPSAGFLDIKNCPLANAVKKVVGHNEVRAGIYNVSIYDTSLHKRTFYSVVPAFEGQNYKELQEGTISEFKTTLSLT